MALDATKNFAKVTVSTGYDNVATSIVLNSGHGAKLPTAPFNLTWWNSTDYPDPSDDPNVEIVRCTSVAVDTLTVTRAQESTTASTKNAAGKVYKMIAGLTAATMSTISSSLGSGFNPSDLTTIWWREDFLQNHVFATSGRNGVGRFAAGSNTGGNTLSFIAGSSLNYPVLAQQSTNAIINNDSFLVDEELGNAYSNLNGASASINWEFVSVLNIPTITTVAAKGGFFNDASSGDTNTNGIFWRFSTNAGDTTWKLVTCSGGVCTVVDSAVTVVAGTNYKLRLYSLAAGVIKLDVTPAGGAVTTVTSSTNIPASSTQLNCAYVLKTYGNSIRSINHGVAYFDITGLTRP